MLAPDKAQKLVDGGTSLRASYKRITDEPGGKDLLNFMHHEHDEALRHAQLELDNQAKACMYLQQSAVYAKIIRRIEDKAS